MTAVAIYLLTISPLVALVPMAWKLKGVRLPLPRLAFFGWFLLAVLVIELVADLTGIPDFRALIPEGLVASVIVRARRQQRGISA